MQTLETMARFNDNFKNDIEAEPVYTVTGHAYEGSNYENTTECPTEAMAWAKAECETNNYSEVWVQVDVHFDAELITRFVFDEDENRAVEVK